MTRHGNPRSQGGDSLFTMRRRRLSEARPVDAKAQIRSAVDRAVE
jgi:hypothetical protein